jgi:tRNA threonylcarbamoyladenosine biosynthesis protein TsaB
MNRLAIETAFETCSVALECNGEVRVRTRTEARGHGALLLPFVDELLAEAGIGIGQLDALVVDRGPGSFTSLRIGLGTAQGLALAHDLPVHPVSSLAMMAMTGLDPGGPETLLVAMDARMGEVYCASYRIIHPDPEGRLLLCELDRERLCAPGEVPVPSARAQGIGTAFSVHADQLPPELAGRLAATRSDVQPDAAALLRLAERTEAVDGTSLAPVYLRDRVTH